MNDFLPELYPLVFKNLSINDLLNCRLVNKRLKYFSENSNHIDELQIQDLEDESTEEDKKINLKLYKKIRSRSLFNLNKSLKSLTIEWINNKFNLTETLSDLNDLKFLEISCDYTLTNDLVINLKKLKYLIIFNNNYELKLDLDTPKLEKIRIYGYVEMNFINPDSGPESIKYLQTYLYKDKLAMFKNLEILKLDLNQDKYLDSNLLSVFKNLKQLKINNNGEMEDFDASLKLNLNIILQNKINSKRDIDIYLMGVKLININQLIDIESCERIEFQIKNIDLLDSSEIRCLDYNDLENIYNDLKNDLPSFFDIFNNFTAIKIKDEVKNNENLIWILESIENLRCLKINSQLDQLIFDNLPNTIRTLTINKDSNLNYDFIFKLTQLNFFFTIYDGDLFDLALKSYLNLKYLNYFTFFLNKKHIEITKKINLFYLKSNYKEIENAIDYDRLVASCNQFKLNHTISKDENKEIE